MECVRPRVASVVEGTSEREALPADREDVRCQTLSPNVCDRADRRDGGGAVVAFVAESATPVLEPDVVGEQLSYLVPAPVGKERVKPIVGSTRGVLERDARVGRLSKRACAASSSAIAASMSSMSNTTCIAIRPSSSRPNRLSNSSRGAPGLVSAVPSSSRVRARRSPRTAIDSIRCAPADSREAVLPHVAIRETEDRLGEADYLPATLDEDIWSRTSARPRPRLRDRSSLHLVASLARTRCPVRTLGASGAAGAAGTSRSPRMPRAFSASAAAPFRSYSPTARSAAARAPAASPAAPNTVASARQASP